MDVRAIATKALRDEQLTHLEIQALAREVLRIAGELV